MADDGPALTVPDQVAVQVTRVTYGRLINTGNYENFKVEGEAIVTPGAPPEDALAGLRLFVDTECVAMAAALKQTNGVSSTYPSAMPDDLTCAECGIPVKPAHFRDGTVWSPEILAGYGRRKHQRVLCLEHYRQANEVRRSAGRVETAY